jgi:pyruvate dehydrogenase E2 component (dihydrolipoamide acetyltransferase)
MAISVVMPALEMAQQTGKLISWLKKEGQSVSKGEPLLEIETDKAVMEVESPGDGVLTGIKVNPGTDVPVGEIIAWILAAGETIPDEIPLDESGRTSKTAVDSAASSSWPSAQSTSAFGLQASPKARRLAREHGIDIRDIQGSGPSGEIHSSDIAVRISARVQPSAATTTLGTVARLMAERTTQSWTTVPHFVVVREVIAESLIKEREKRASEIHRATGIKLTHSDLLIALIAKVLERHPRVNASWHANEIRENPDINIALAIAVPEGVVAPVIRRAHKLKLTEIAIQRRDLAERTREGKLRPEDLADPTFTISNLGMYGVDAFTAIINPPQAAILAVGSIAERVVVVDGLPGVRHTMTLSLSCDHRVLDGAKGAEFLRDVTLAITQPDLRP